MSVDSKDNNTSKSEGTSYDEWSLNSNSSRIGVKGSEDLGNRMKVGYLIEWTVDMDGDSSNDLSTRNRAVTLSGDWGTALAGKWDTPFKTVGRKLDLFGDKIGDTRSLNSGALMDQRAPNVVAYVTPNMNGLSATVAYVWDVRGSGNPGDDSDYSAWSANAIYKNGPIMVAAAYSNYSDTIFGANAEDETLWRVGGSYKFGDFKVLASYTDISDANGNDGKDTDIWTVGAAYTMGNNTIKAQYGSRDEYDDTKGAPGSGNETGADMWSVGIDHKMSKRTTVYAAYASTSNDDFSTSTSWGGGHDKEGNAPAAGNDADAFSVGIIHKF
jgi:predicted porin